MKVQDMLLGVAVGDAFGVGLETKDRDWLREHIKFDKYVSFRTGKYAEGYRLGDYSDDTADTLAVMRTMAGYTQYTEQNLLGEMFAEYLDSKWVRGGTPRAGYGSVKWYFDGKSTIDEVRKFQAGRNVPGNAPAMRSVPLGLLKDQRDIEPYAKVTSYVTHPHVKGWASSVAIARAARYHLLWKDDPEGTVVYGSMFLRHIDEEFAAYLRVVDKLPPELNEAQFEVLCGTQPVQSYVEGEPNFKGMNGDAMHTAGTALYILKHAKDPFDALKMSIRMGGDVDSLAAITVGITGGRYGLSSLPPFLLEGLEDRSLLIGEANRFEEWLRK